VTALAAVLIDMDGLLVDSEPVWTVAETELAAALGGAFTAELKAAIVGTRLEVAVPTILAWYDAPRAEPDIAATSAWLLRRVAELFAGELPLLPGAGELLADLREAGVPVALVSSSYRVLVDAVLGQGIGPFAVTIAGDEVVHAKPDPEPYLTACSRLGVDPRAAVVLEDSPAGVASGEAAGCAVVAVPSVAGVNFSAAPRRLVVPALTKVGLPQLAALVVDR